MGQCVAVATRETLWLQQVDCCHCCCNTLAPLNTRFITGRVLRQRIRQWFYSSAAATRLIYGVHLSCTGSRTLTRTAAFTFVNVREKLSVLLHNVWRWCVLLVPCDCRGRKLNYPPKLFSGGMFIAPVKALSVCSDIGPMNAALCEATDALQWQQRKQLFHIQ